MAADGFLLFSDTGRSYINENFNAEAKISIFIVSDLAVLLF